MGTGWEPLIRGSGMFQRPPRPNLMDFFLQFNTYKIYILQQIWSKLTNPALSSGPNNLLPLIWGSHNQLDDQYKEPMQFCIC